MAAHGQALQFLEAFPEAKAFSIALLTEEKRAIVSKPQCSRAAIVKELEGWLAMRAVHFFIRPLMANLVMLDLDAYGGDMDVLVALQPRALVRTSPGNYQAWLTLPDTLPGKTALWATTQLTAALGGDMASAKVTQQGRLPGSINVKHGKGQPAVLLHAKVQNLCEATFLRVTAKTDIKGDGASVSAHQKQPRVKAPDLSAHDWAMCCEFFEHSEGATVEDALAELSGKFSAKRANQAYYEKLTATNAHKKVASKKSTAAPSPADPAPQQGPAGARGVFVTTSEVQRMISDALKERFPLPDDAAKKCVACGKFWARAGFAAGQWALARPVCLECKPVNDNLRKRAKDAKTCAACGR